MTSIPEILKQIMGGVKSTGQPHKTTPRRLIAHYDAVRRGRSLASQIRSALKEFDLTTIPDFETSYIDGEIELVLIHPPAVVDDAPVPLDAPVSTPEEFVKGGSVSDPVARIRMLAAANRLLKNTG